MRPRPPRKNERFPGIGVFSILGSGLIIGFFLLCSGASAAQPIQIRSQSGQFVVQGVPLGGYQTPRAATGDVVRLELDPSLLTVALERIKTALLRELRLRDHWRGPVYLQVGPRRPLEAPIVVRSVRHLDNWSYRVVLPREVDRHLIVRVAVEVLLREMAHRGSGGSELELPPWLVPGLVAELEFTSLADFTLPPSSLLAHSQRGLDPMKRIRALLRQYAPLSLDSLNLSPPEAASGPEAEVYIACAQLFVHELLRLRDGPQLLGSMLASFPDFLNWQTAFLLTYQEYFPRLIDVDKWWSLNLIHVTGRELASVWSLDESWRRLDEALLAPVRVRARFNEMPIDTRVPLQQIIREWDPDPIDVMLLRKLNQLTSLRPRVTGDLVSLVDDYRAALEVYLQKSPIAHPKENGKPAASVADPTRSREMIQKLDGLDLRRERLRALISAVP